MTVAHGTVDEARYGRLAEANLSKLIDAQWQSPFGDSWRGYLRVDQYEVAQTISIVGTNKLYKNDYVLLAPMHPANFAAEEVGAKNTAKETSTRNVWVTKNRKRKALPLNRFLNDGEIHGVAERFSNLPPKTQDQIAAIAKEREAIKFHPNDLIIEFGIGTPCMQHWSFYVSISLMAFSMVGLLVGAVGLGDEQDQEAAKSKSRAETTASIRVTDHPKVTRFLVDSRRVVESPPQPIAEDLAADRELATIKDISEADPPVSKWKSYINRILTFMIVTIAFAFAKFYFDSSAWLDDTGVALDVLLTLAKSFAYVPIFTGLYIEFLREPDSIVLKKHHDSTTNYHVEHHIPQEHQSLLNQMEALGFADFGEWTLGRAISNELTSRAFVLSPLGNVLVTAAIKDFSIYTATTDGKLIETSNQRSIGWKRKKQYQNWRWLWSGKRTFADALELHIERVKQYLDHNHTKQIAFTEQSLKPLLARRYERESK